MNGSIKRTNYEVIEDKLMAESCNFSGYSMAAIAGGLIFCIGIILYAILAT